MQPAVLCVAVILTAAIVSPAEAGMRRMFAWRKPPQKSILKNCVAAMADRLKQIKALAGPDGSGQPIIAEARVAFNGQGAEAGEAFEFPGNVESMDEEMHWNRCETDGKPYDAAVVDCLSIAQKHFPDRLIVWAVDPETDPEMAQALFPSGDSKPAGTDAPWWLNLLISAGVIAGIAAIVQRTPV